MFAADQGQGWRASRVGEQVIRLIFDQPIFINRIHLQFNEVRLERTQEFTLHWSSAHGDMPKEIVRQQWNFSPVGSTNEVEHYDADLEEVAELELTIKPDLGKLKAPASSQRGDSHEPDTTAVP